MKKNNLYQTFLNAANGIWLTLKSERNFQIETAALLINLCLIFTLKLSAVSSILIMMVCFLVLALEMVNTALEKLADFAEPHFNKKIGIIKDIAAGSVLMAAILALIVGAVIYFPLIMAII